MPTRKIRRKTRRYAAWRDSKALQYKVFTAKAAKTAEKEKGDKLVVEFSQDGLWRDGDRHVYGNREIVVEDKETTQISAVFT